MTAQIIEMPVTVNPSPQIIHGALMELMRLAPDVPIRFSLRAEPRSSLLFYRVFVEGKA